MDLEHHKEALQHWSEEEEDDEEDDDDSDTDYENYYGNKMKNFANRNNRKGGSLQSHLQYFLSSELVTKCRELTPM